MGTIKKFFLPPLCVCVSDLSSNITHYKTKIYLFCLLKIWLWKMINYSDTKKKPKPNSEGMQMMIWWKPSSQKHVFKRWTSDICRERKAWKKLENFLRWKNEEKNWWIHSSWDSNWRTTLQVNFSSVYLWNDL